MLPILRLIRDGHETIPECLPHLAREFGLSDDEEQRLLPSGRQTYLSNRAHWARNYMSQAGLVSAVRRGHYVLTDDGRSLLDEQPPAIDKETLKRYAKFRAWLDKSNGDGSEQSGSDSPAAVDIADDVTPEERIDGANRQLQSELIDEVLARVLDCSPAFFEQLIVDLLIAMGYGRGNPDAGSAIGRSGDGGIDGIIDEDALGLDAVYIQAKRYAPENKVGRPAIQQFVGSLTGESATKGVFVTTSDFSAEARAYVSRVQQRIVLVDGRQLARLMIANEIGVRTRQVYKLRSVDEDYFIDV